MDVPHIFRTLEVETSGAVRGIHQHMVLHSGEVVELRNRHRGSHLEVHILQEVVHVRPLEESRSRVCRSSYHAAEGYDGDSHRVLGYSLGEVAHDGHNTHQEHHSHHDVVENEIFHDNEEPQLVPGCRSVFTYFTEGGTPRTSAVHRTVCPLNSRLSSFSTAVLKSAEVSNSTNLRFISRMMIQMLKCK